MAKSFWALRHPTTPSLHAARNVVAARQRRQKIDHRSAAAPPQFRRAYQDADCGRISIQIVAAGAGGNIPRAGVALKTLAKKWDEVKPNMP